MSLSDSMFLFEIVVEEIKSLVHCQEFNITSQFADLFTLNLKDPHELEVAIPKRTRKKSKRKSKVRDSKAKILKANVSAVEPKIRIGQSILIANNVDSLKANMKAYPLQLTLWNKVDRQRVMGSTNIPWSTAFIAYLNDLIRHRDVPPVTVDGIYNVFDELYSKRMATIKISIKLSCLKDKVTTQFRSLSEEDPQTFMYTGFNSKPTTILSTIKEKKVAKHDVAIDATNDTGKIRTIYSGGKKKFKRLTKEKNKNSKATTKPIQSSTIPLKKTRTNLNRSTETAEPEPSVIKNEPTEPQKIEKERSEQKINEKIIDLVKSDTDLEVNKQVALIKSKSYSSLEYENHLNTLNYIFGDGKGPFGNQVYCVGYFTVQKDTSSKSSSSLEESEEKKEKFKFRLCASECPGRKTTSGSRSLSHCSIDVPQGAADLIKVTKCDHVECDGKKHREPPPPPDDRILIDLSGLKGDCCNITEKVEQVVGGMTAKMQVGKDPCYCTCECRFGFTKKTTYCKICGGYEISGDELSRKPAIDMPFPCPIFHKLEKRGKSCSAESRKSRRKSMIDRSGESEKDGKKGKKKKKDDRFKFNYGYQGIPPQIGHSQCAMPCSGTLGNVPKHMGWLWTAEDVPGMKEVARGWRPGAISRRLLRKLNMAKLQRYTVAHRKPLKKTKKRAENKPTLIICKVNGEYRVEMQVSQENSDGNYEQYTPLVYKIAKANNKDKVSKLERKKRRLIKKAVGNVWDDPYHPEVCEKTCLRAYKQAVGLLPYDPNNPDCTCSDYERKEPVESSSCSCDDDDISSDCSSMEVDWEIHFTPPNAHQSLYG